MSGRHSSGPVLSVILGRAGSRGLPGKNARPIAGQPMIAWTVLHAARSASVDHLVVSTDGAEIAAAATAAAERIAIACELVLRPPELAHDTASVVDAARHAVERWEAPRDARASIVTILYANVPVRPADLTDRAVAALRAGGDSVQSYADVGKHHPAWMVSLGADGRVTPLDPNAPDRRQELPPLRLPDGGVIAVWRDGLDLGPHPHAFLGADRRGIVSEPGAVVDVDDAGDLAVAEARLLQDCARQSPPRTAV